MHPITKYYREMRDRLVEKEMETNYETWNGWLTPTPYVNIKKTIERVEINTPKHYDNSKGSLYKFAEDHGLNAWEFDILKRVIRCRKKGQFLEDIDKTIEVLKLYKKEYYVKD